MKLYLDLGVDRDLNSDCVILGLFGVTVYLAVCWRIACRPTMSAVSRKDKTNNLSH